MQPATAPNISEAIESYYEKEFAILKDTGRLVDDWANVYEHCKKEAEVAWTMACLLHLSPDDLEILVPAAILYDWYKRNEREAANAAGGSPEEYNKAANRSFDGLLELGYSQRLVEVAHAVGHTAILSVAASDDLLKKVMFFIDNVVNGDQLVELDERMDALEAAPRYKELNESGRSMHGGKTYFEAQRGLSKKIQVELEKAAGIAPGELINELKKAMEG